MQYRSFPKIPQLEISTLSFGCMRLPVLNGDYGRIDEEKATQLLHDAFAAGVNYIDTAWPYHAGQSEPFVGRAIKGVWRDRVQLATKLPVWMVTDESDWERLLDSQLEKLDTNRIDFYLMHSLTGEYWHMVQKLRGMQALERARADGRIGHIGFSFHSSLDDFKLIIDGYDWEFCQIQYNYLDEQYQAGTEGLRYATERKVGVVVMEPLRGGTLAQVPSAVQKIWDRSPRSWPPAEWALRWVCNHPQVVTVLSGMNAPGQLRENLRIVNSPTAMSAQDHALIEEVKNFYQARTRVPCTTCGYCMPCPSGVSIPNALTLYNDAVMFESKIQPAMIYDQFFVRNEAGAERCVECGECEPKCPQQIPITEKLKEAHKYLTGK